MKRKLGGEVDLYCPQLHAEWVRKRKLIQKYVFSTWAKEDRYAVSFESQREVFIRKFYRWCQKFQTKVSAHGGMNPVLRYPLHKVMEEDYLGLQFRTAEPLEEDPAYMRLFAQSSQGPPKKRKKHKHRCIQVQFPAENVKL
jgi:hypothetical protein